MIIIDAPKLSRKMRNRSDDCLLPNLRERVAGAPTCSRIAYENATLQQVENVAKRGIRGARCDLRPLRCREVALEPVQQTIQYEALTVVDGNVAHCLPETRFVKNRREGCLRTVDGTQCATLDRKSTRLNSSH